MQIKGMQMEVMLCVSADAPTCHSLGGGLSYGAVAAMHITEPVGRTHRTSIFVVAYSSLARSLMAPHQIVAPHTQAVIAAVEEASLPEALAVLDAGRAALPAWRSTPLPRRIELVANMVDRFMAHRDEIANELAGLIGRPLRHCQNELNGFHERATHLLSIAPTALSPTTLPEKPGFKRHITREPLGLVLLISAWNYPHLIAVNGALPALLAGNVVVVKAAPQTYPCGEWWSRCAREAGIPEGVVGTLKAGHAVLADVLRDPRVDHVHFTGSVRGGREVAKVLAGRFIGLGLELGGKDPAYVRADADPATAAENIVDGACYNSGQSCCAVERVYAHADVYDRLVEECVKVVSGYKLGDPFDPQTSLGPVVKAEAAEAIREQVEDAVSKGAKKLVDESLFPLAKKGSAFVAPQVLVNVDHSMKIMKEETFGPVFGIMKVKSDEEAIKLMNDSEFGLTASVWTKDNEKAEEIMSQLDAGTVFLNRCDYLDPALPWCGWKDSGRGITLSHLGFDAVTRPKGFHMRMN
ncbi:hypothetical protein HK101_000810 [Irineochytrium annulatum]|nr:hypothetical protein HK101_000810 [Irineochytrium annulatum]